MSVEKLGNNKYRIRKMVDGIRQSITIDYKPTRAELAQIEADLCRVRTLPEIRSMTFCEAYTDLIRVKYDVLSPSTRRGYQIAYKRLSEDFTRLKIGQIELLHIQREITALSAVYSPKTVKNTGGLITAVLALYRPEVTYRIKYPQAVKPTLYLPTTDDVSRILQEVKGTKYYIPFILGAKGLRRSEIMALTLADLDGQWLHIHQAVVSDEQNREILKTTKTVDSDRTIKLPSDIADAIRSQGYIYHGCASSLWKALTRIQDRLGIPHFRFHDLRAFYASCGHEVGISDQMLQSGGGWSSDKIMKSRYRRTAQDAYERSQDAFNAVLSNLLD